MKAAVVTELGKNPSYCDFEDPAPLANELRIKVSASALTNFTRMRAAGMHSSSTTRPPFVPGIDGVGRLDDGRRVYFLFPRAPFGGMAEMTIVPSARCIPVPDDVDDITLAALADPGMSAWVALEVRAGFRPGETVLVNGATGSAGGIAVQVAKYLGAKAVIATGRNGEALKSLLSRGADEIVDLTLESATLQATLQEMFARGIDVVLDYLWGTSAEQILAATAHAERGAVPMRFIQIGTTSAPTIALSGSILRASAIEIKGSGIGSVGVEPIMTILSKLIEAAPAAKFRIATRPVPLSSVEEVWSAEAVAPRVVFTMGS